MSFGPSLKLDTKRYIKNMNAAFFDISKLDKRITIQRQIKTASDGMGGFTTAWVDVITVWAAIWPKNGKEVVQDQQPSSVSDGRIRIVHRRGVSTQNRLKYVAAFGKIKYFNVVGIVNPNESNEWLDLIYKEVG